MSAFGPLTTTDWLAAHSRDPGVKIVDGSWRMPGQPPAREDYSRRHIPGAVFFDIDAVADTSTDLPHMLPAPQTFADAVGALGISERDKIVVYDDQGIFSAARVWWTFRAMGHEHAAVLNGGLLKWLKEQRPVTDAPVSPSPAAYSPSFNASLVSNAGDVRCAIEKNDTLIADARPADRFYGKAPEPRPGLRSGRMPNAKSIPSNALLNPDGTMRDKSALAALFAAAGVLSDTPVITTCGSGVTAAVLSLGLEIIGHGDQSLYDGSWAEWGDERNGIEDYPVV